MSIESTVIITGVVAWFAHGWYLNERLAKVHAKLDRVLDQFDGLRDYLYEIDTEFDDERESRQTFEGEQSMFAGANDMELLRRKKSLGKRTLDTPFADPAN
jgi:hypothetical protein